MRLLMATSADGWLCRSPDDDMSWTGRDDKVLFRALTSVGGVCAVGARTPMPARLPGRRLLRLRRRTFLGPDEISLDAFHIGWPSGWLLGGFTVAIEALRRGLVDEVHLCVSDVRLGPCPEGTRADKLLGVLVKSNLVSGHPETTHRFGTVTHEVWRMPPDGS